MYMREEFDKLNEKVTALEKRANLATAIATAFVIGFPIAFGIQYIKIPEIAANRAEKATNDVIDVRAEKIIKEQVSLKLQQIIDRSDEGSKILGLETYFLQSSAYANSIKEHYNSVAKKMKHIEELNVPKAWGVYQSDGQGNGTIVSGYNIKSAKLTPSSGEGKPATVKIEFKNPIKSGYCAIASSNLGAVAIQADGNNSCILVPISYEGIDKNDAVKYPTRIHFFMFPLTKKENHETTLFDIFLKIMTG